MARKEKMFHYIYKTTNLLSGKYYLGMHSTNNLDDGYMGSGKRLKYSINKHGKDNHKVEILEFINSREELRKREEEIVNLNEIAKVDCMNLKVGGDGGFSSEEHRLKATTAAGLAHINKMEKDEEFRNKVLNRLNEGRKVLVETGAYKKKGKGLGRIHSEETKKLMSESSKDMGRGNKNSQFGTCWITKDGENKKIKKEDLDSFIKDGWERGRK